jgi:hypothetical protein
VGPYTSTCQTPSSALGLRSGCILPSSQFQRVPEGCRLRVPRRIFSPARLAGWVIRVRNCLPLLMPEGTVDPLLLSVLANGLSDGEDMPLVERLIERGTAVPGCTERDPLLGHRRVRRLGVIGRDELGHVHQHRWLGWLSRKRTYFHKRLRRGDCRL